jgi:two-component system chemotaxis sensor kinase CheA
MSDFGTITVLLEEACAAVVLVEPDDLESLEALSELYAKLAGALPEGFGLKPREELEACRSILSRLEGGISADPHQDLEHVVARTTRLRDDIHQRVRDRQGARAPSPGPQPRTNDPAVTRFVMTPGELASGPPGGGGELVLPAEVDEELFAEFLSTQRLALEELEQDILALEGGDQTRMSELRRRIHTMKGESGVVGLEPLAEVCHAVEDFLDAERALPQQVDVLLSVRDWFVNTLADAAVFQLPTTPARQVVELLKEAAQNEGATASVSPRRVVVSPPAAGAETKARTHSVHALDRDAKTSPGVGGSGDLAPRVRELLAATERVLLRCAKDGFAPHAAELCHNFADIGELIASLELALFEDLTLAAARLGEGLVQADPEIQDQGLVALTEVTLVLHELAELVNRRGSVDDTLVAHTREIFERLETLGAGLAADDLVLPRAAPAQPLGEILKDAGLISTQLLQAGLAEQQATGGLLGEALMRKSVPPADVARGLVAQRRASQRAGAIRQVIRVDLERIDTLVELIGELVTTEAMVSNAPELEYMATSALRAHLGQLTKITRDLQEVGMRMRTVPVRHVFQKMARMVRDLERRGRKRVQLRITGETTEMDRMMVEAIADPLTHIIRNAVDHGIEEPEARRAAGKPEVGTISLAAVHEGGSIFIEIRDDGGGLDRQKVLDRARVTGLVGPDDRLTDEEIDQLIFAPGFSTANQVTDLSGRGVGLDVVKSHVDAMRGRILITSAPGVGTSFRLILPLTLAIIDGMVVACGSERYILPTLTIVESLQPTRGMLSSLAGQQELVQLRGEVLPLLRMSQLFGIDGAKTDPCEGLVVVVESVGHKAGLMVDDVVAQQQVVIKSLGPGLRHVERFSGSAILSDGRVALIVDVDRVLRSAVAPGRNVRRNGVHTAKPRTEREDQ